MGAVGYLEGLIARRLPFRRLAGIHAGPRLGGKATTLGDHLKLSHEGKRLLGTATAESKVADPVKLASEIMGATDADAVYDKLRGLTAKQLRAAAAASPGVVDRFDALVRSKQANWITRLDDVLKPLGLSASGPVKSWDAAISKLDRWSAENAASGKGPATLGELNDLTRARIDTDVLSHDRFLLTLVQLRQNLQKANPESDFQFVTRDYAQIRTLSDRSAKYRGRVNVTINERVDGKLKWAFELQIGPSGLSKFWEHPFRIAGSNHDFSLHEAVYKGICRLEDADQFARIGHHLNRGKALTFQDAVTAGRQAVRRATTEYENQLDHAIADLRMNRPVDYGRTADLREQVAAIVLALKGYPRVPAGLQG